MIKTQYQVPSNYSNESRDFQLFGHLYDAVFNDVKMKANLILNNPLNKNTDKKLLELAARTLGFIPKHNYDDKNLYNICSAFKEIVKYKGTIKSINLAIYALLNAQGLEGTDYSIEKDDNDSNSLKIILPGNTQDVILLEDIMEYILPVGCIYSIVNYDAEETYATKITSQDEVTNASIKEFLNNIIVNKTTDGNSVYNSITTATVANPEQIITVTEEETKNE